MEKLEIRKFYSVQKQALFKAWTESPALEKWWEPGSYANLAPGHDFCMKHSFDGKQEAIQGRYQQIVLNEKISASFKWTDDAQKTESFFSVEFIEKDHGTELYLKHEMPEGSSRGCEKGWNSKLKNLTNYFEYIRESYNYAYDWSYFTIDTYIKRNPSEIFNAWTKSSEITKWFVRDSTNFRNEIELDASAKVQSGDTYHWRWTDCEDQWGTFLNVVENQSVRFTFGDGNPISPHPIVVDLSFLAMPSGYTRVSLTQKNMPLSARTKSSWHLSCHQGWNEYLQNLKATLESGHDLRIGEAQKHFLT